MDLPSGLQPPTQAEDADEDLFNQMYYDFENNELMPAKISRDQPKDGKKNSTEIASDNTSRNGRVNNPAMERYGFLSNNVFLDTENFATSSDAPLVADTKEDKKNLGAVPKKKTERVGRQQQQVSPIYENPSENGAIPFQTRVVSNSNQKKIWQRTTANESQRYSQASNYKKTRALSYSERAENKKGNIFGNMDNKVTNMDIQMENTTEIVDNKPNDAANGDVNRVRTRRGGRKRGGVKQRNQAMERIQRHQTPVNQEPVKVLKEVLPYKSDNIEDQFQEQMNDCERRIVELESAVLRLKFAQVKAKPNPKKSDENALQIETLEAKIFELEMQKENARVAFDRTSSQTDAEIRKKRELFRLVARLPALAKRQHFEKALDENQFIVVMGQTGSGKSTQLTQYIADMTRFNGKYVICTQPRKIAAVTLSRRVAFEYSGGQETPESKQWVGCHVGGETRLHISNRIRYMTETVLLNQLTLAEVTGQKDLFRDCCAVIVDEAHSRTITTDVLLGVLKRKIHLWPHLKIVVTSATIDTNLFSKYLNDCPVIDIPGRLFPVQVVYCPFNRETGKIVDAVVNQAVSICNQYHSGDILCFLTGQNEVEWAKKRFMSIIRPGPSRAKRIVAYCLYGKQTPEEQQKVFVTTPDIQKVIFSTDIAETSITIDGVKFIVDSGLTKNLVFDSARNITSLKEMMISSASAEQRKGRAGRTGPGTCYRIYSEDDYNAMPKYDKAEIFLRPLSVTVTLLKSMQVDPRQFEWLEKPANVALDAALEELYLLGALDHLGDLTPLGHLVSDLQIDPGIAHMIQYACSKGFGNIATNLAGLFSVASLVFWRGSDDETRQASNESKKNFFDPKGDILTCYRAFNQWLNLKMADPTLRTAKGWCTENYINNKAMSMALSTAQEIEINLKRNAMHVWRRNDQSKEANNEELQQLIAQAFVLNVAYKVNKNYVALRADTMTYVHPGSVFFREVELAQVVVYQNILSTSKTYALQITPIDMEWIRQENGALHALYEEKKSQVNICEVRITPVSRGILRFILGPANRNVDQLNNDLDCVVHGEYEKDALVAWCKPNACNFVHSELSRRIKARKLELESEIREDPIVGDTRIVWGCGGEAKMLMFRGDFIGIHIQNVPLSWNLSDVHYTVSQKISQPIKDSLRNVLLLPATSDRSSKTARLIFDDPSKADTAFTELSKSLRKPLEVSPMLANRPSVYKESEAWLNISFAIAPSNKSAIIMYNTAEDANCTLDRGCLNFRPSTAKNGLNNPEVQNFRFVPELKPSKLRMQYVLYANRLPIDFDESSVEAALANSECPKPPYMKIIRGQEMKFDNDSFSPLTTDQVDAVLLNYAISNELLPLADKILRVNVLKDTKRKKVVIRARYQSIDQIEMIQVSQLIRSQHYDQPVRVETLYKTSLRLEKPLWNFRRIQIEDYLKTIGNVRFKIDANKYPTHAWIYLDVSQMETIQDIRKRIDTFLTFQLYKNGDIQLLFTHYGQKLLSSLNVKAGYLNWNSFSKSIRIYGEEAERKIIKGQLDQLVQHLQHLCIDVPLIIRKTSLMSIQKNLNTYKNIHLHDELRLSYNRLFATGTEEGIQMLKTNLGDHLIQPKNEIEVGDCGVCWTPLENPIYLQLCAHGFCADCIKAMVDQDSIPYPIICPVDGCGSKLCLKDIQEIASVSVMEKISQSAIAALQTNCPDKFRNCFKTGCEQYIPIRNATPEAGNEINRLSGDAVYCDQCNVNYCFTCSTAMKKPVEQHRGSTCTENQRSENKDARQHRLYILDEICLLRCPRCKTAFIDFDGCCALYCSMARCKAGFCFFCLTDCGNDAHNHVRSCPKNLRKSSYYIDASEKNKIHKESRKRAIVDYLMKTCRDRGMRSTVLHSIVKDLKDLEIVINPSEVNLTGYVPLIETSQHRDHILDKICTLHCPKCQTAFFDFDGCSALTCARNTCKTKFCFFCLKGFGQDEQRTFAHVIQCPENIVPGQLRTPENLIEEVNRRRYKKAIVNYLKTHCQDVNERQAVIDSVSINLKQLNVSIDSKDFAIPIPVRVNPILAEPNPPYLVNRQEIRVPAQPARPPPPIQPQQYQHQPHYRPPLNEPPLYERRNLNVVYGREEIPVRAQPARPPPHFQPQQFQHQPQYGQPRYEPPLFEGLHRPQAGPQRRQPQPREENKCTFL